MTGPATELRGSPNTPPTQTNIHTLQAAQSNSFVCVCVCVYKVSRYRRSIGRLCNSKHIKILNSPQIRLSASVSFFYTPTHEAGGKPALNANAGQKKNNTNNIRLDLGCEKKER